VADFRNSEWSQGRDAQAGLLKVETLNSQL
jgi:hypothetical protein